MICIYLFITVADMQIHSSNAQLMLSVKRGRGTPGRMPTLNSSPHFFGPTLKYLSLYNDAFISGSLQHQKVRNYFTFREKIFLFITFGNFFELCCVKQNLLKLESLGNFNPVNHSFMHSFVLNIQLNIKI